MTPAWKSWPLPTEPTNVLAWHTNECAMCGAVGDGQMTRIVEDHCHDTGLIRGHLCRSCNNSEGQGNGPQWEGWRAWDNPAKALNSPELYTGWHWWNLRQDADLYYCTPEERREWEAEQAIAAAERRDWPTSIHVDITERRAAADARSRAAVNAISGAS